jgi:hypothetical protein
MLSYSTVVQRLGFHLPGIGLPFETRLKILIRGTNGAAAISGGISRKGRSAYFIQGVRMSGFVGSSLVGFFSLLGFFTFMAQFYAFWDCPVGV